MMEARYAWELSQIKTSKLAKELQEQCQVSPLLAQLLVQRGIEPGPGVTKRYMDPQLAESA